MDGCWGKTLTSSPPFWSVFHFSVSLSWLFSPLGAPLFSLSRVPPSLPDCNNSNNDNNGDGPGDGDVKKHNIRITNTFSNQWPSFDLCGCECVRTLCAHSLELLKTQICVCERAGEKRRDRERQWGRGSLLACCIYGHFLSSLNRAGCAGNLRSPLQMVCIMFKPPCHHPSLSSLSLSLPLSSFLYKSSKSQTLCVRKKTTPLCFLPAEGHKKKL